ncbi:MAG: hypothetical protein ACREL7_18320, partial [Longimicrobiales bacterium]
HSVVHNSSVADRQAQTGGRHRSIDSRDYLASTVTPDVETREQLTLVDRWSDFLLVPTEIPRWISKFNQLHW